MRGTDNSSLQQNMREKLCMCEKGSIFEYFRLHLLVIEIGISMSTLLPIRSHTPVFTCRAQQSSAVRKCWARKRPKVRQNREETGERGKKGVSKKASRKNWQNGRHEGKGREVRDDFIENSSHLVFLFLSFYKLFVQFLFSLPIGVIFLIESTIFPPLSSYTLTHSLSPGSSPDNFCF